MNAGYGLAVRWSLEAAPEGVAQGLSGLGEGLRELAAVVRESGKLLIVDSVSGAGACELNIDEWGIDVLVTAAQKAWGAPPGVAIVTMSDKAWKAYDRSDLPKAYFDLQSYKAALEKGATPATPAPAADAVTTTIERDASTAALKGSTEDEQFFDRKHA